MTIPDFPKDVSGHDAQEGVQEEPDEDLDPVAADGQDTGQPVAVVDLGEKRRGSRTQREVGYSESHLVRPLHLSNLNVKKVRHKLLNESGIKKKFKTKLCD